MTLLVFIILAALSPPILFPALLVLVWFYRD